VRNRKGTPKPITNLTSRQDVQPSEPPDRPRLQRKLAIFQFAIVIIFVLLSAQIWRLQIAHGAEYRSHADRNRFRLLFTDSPRGVIYDRNQTLLVKNVPSFSVSLIPADIPPEKEEAILAKLSDLLSIPVTSEKYDSETQDPFSGADSRERSSPSGMRELLEDGRSTPFTPVQIKTNVSREVAFILEEEHLNLPGVIVEVDPVRQYVQGDLTSHVIGYVGGIPRDRADEYLEDPAEDYDPNDRVGLNGVELTFERQLRGAKGSRYVEVDYLGREMRPIGDPISPLPGNNLHLTLDLRLQKIADDVLQDALARILSNSGVVIAMDPRNGEILAMVSIPSYDNNLFSHGISARDYEALSADPLHPLVNHAISGQYPPGSVFKLITAPAALEDGVLDYETRFLCQGTMSIPDKYVPERTWPFYCWLSQGHGKVNVVEAVAQSCDIYFYVAAGGLGEYPGLGADRLADYARAFGLGEPTGIKLSGESSGLVPDAEWKWDTYKELWLTGDTYNMAIGQGQVLATPLQMLNATAAIASGGVLYKPQIVQEITDAEGRLVESFEPEEIRRIPISEEHVALTLQGMRDAVTHGTAIEAYHPSLEVAGKTGTAEYFGPRDRQGDLPTHAWYTCFAPAEDPEIALVVFVEGGGEGSQIAVPIGAEILRQYFDLPEFEAPTIPEPQPAVEPSVPDSPAPAQPNLSADPSFRARLLAVHDWSSDISSVIGTVVDSNGNGVPNVQLTINGGGSPIFEPTTGADGRFQYDMLNPWASPVYNIRLLSYAESEELHLDVEPGKRYVVEFREVVR
jgi:penicillin-binding protein 2